MNSRMNDGVQLRLATVMWRPGAGIEAGEWNLIHGRHACLCREYGVQIYTFAIRRGGESPTPSHWGAAGYRVNIVPYQYRLLGQFAGAWRATVGAIKTRPDAILFSGGFSSMWHFLAQRRGIKTVWDVHGACEAEAAEYRIARSDAARIPLMRFKEATAIGCDGCFVVSEELAVEVMRRHRDARVFVVPCASNAHLSPLEYETSRQSWRAHWGIPGNATVFAHSGGVRAGWQSAHLYFRDFCELLRRYPSAWLLCLTHEVSVARAMLLQMESRDPLAAKRVTIDTVPATQLVNALCAADLGLLLREYSATNLVAFPNKLDEYLAAGLHLITTPGLPAAVKILGAGGGAQGVVLPGVKLAEFANFAATIDLNPEHANIRWKKAQNARIRHSFSETLAPFIGWINPGPTRFMRG